MVSYFQSHLSHDGFQRKYSRHLRSAWRPVADRHDVRLQRWFYFEVLLEVTVPVTPEIQERLSAKKDAWHKSKTNGRQVKKTTLIVCSVCELPSVWHGQESRKPTKYELDNPELLEYPNEWNPNNKTEILYVAKYSSPMIKSFAGMLHRSCIGKALTNQGA